MYLGQGEGDEEDGASDENVMPTGRVVGILQRNWREYVASFASDEVHSFGLYTACYPGIHYSHCTYQFVSGCGTLWKRFDSILYVFCFKSQKIGNYKNYKNWTVEII